MPVAWRDKVFFVPGRFSAARLILAIGLFASGCATQIPFGGEPMPADRVAMFMKVLSPRGEYDQPPKFIHGLAPTSQLSKSGIWGYTEIEFTVRADGSTGQFQFTNATDPYFARQAGLAVQKWTFQPARKAGRPVPVRVWLPFTFRT
ncbi:MAG TPA: energy transducer TonB [Chthoniobacterales bacterium]|nr:energy transducer TonB [Chthoniobacterales bacterium]